LPILITFLTVFIAMTFTLKAFGNDLKSSIKLKGLGYPVISENWMISAANPYAANAGAEILAKGGSASDAMIATQTVLGLVEPQSSGLGGGAFLIWYDAASKNIITLDGRETASRHATPKLFQNHAGQPIKFYDAVVGGKSVGVPGIPALMLEAHKRWGKLEWAKLFDKGIELSESGFIVSPRLSMLVDRDKEYLLRSYSTANYFYPNGKNIESGQILKNLNYAKTLRSIASDKGKSFYHGDIANDIVRTVQSFTDNPGLLDQLDLSSYQVKERPAVCINYRSYNVCGMGPPSSGGITVGQILGILEPYNLSKLGPKSANAWHLIGEASRLAFADRDRYIADSDYEVIPTNGLLDNYYLGIRSSLINKEQALEEILPGKPPFDTTLLLEDDESIEMPSTSHISIVDQYGNALSMTTTIENSFGSKLMTKGGFLLNNELTDFSFQSHKNGIPIANRIEAGKRPRSSMAPTILLKNSKPHLIIGSPGGSRIIGYVVQAIIAYVDWGMNVQQAVSMPHIINRYGTFDLEKGTNAEIFSNELSAKGFKINLRTLNSGLHAIAITDINLEGGADPRREGIVIGK